jgi:cbb3-type cytochrome oxidase subunit 3
MSKIVGKLLEDVAWLQNLSGFLTLFFLLIFIVIIVRVLSWKKEQVEEYKNLPLTDEEPDER